MTGRRILLGVTGGIAAYKTAELVRQFKRAGAEVRVVMTPDASAYAYSYGRRIASALYVTDDLR